MAIQFARAEYVSRSKGKNACCKSAYNARDIINDQKTNVIYNFQRLRDNVHHEILLPKYVDTKFNNVKVLANAVEKSEKRKDSQLYKEYVLALPDDQNVSLDLKKEMVYEFIKRSKFIEEGLGVQFDIHKPHDGEKNWHAHLLVTTRRFTKDGLGFENKKAIDLQPQIKQGNGKVFVSEKNNIGELWKNIQNESFEKHGLEIRVDQIAKEGGVHLGPVRMRGLMNEVAQFHAERQSLKTPVFENGNDLLDHITEKAAVFTYEDLQRAVKDIKDNVFQLQLINEAMQSDRLVTLYRDNGTETSKWTTQAVRAEEERALRIADAIHKFTPNVSDHYSTALKNLVDHNQLNAHQGQALSGLLATDKNASGLRILKGRAGTGKTYMLGQLNTLVRDNQAILALSPTHKAVSELKAQGFDNTHTVKAFLFKYRHDRIVVPKGSLFVIDEAAMLGTESTLELLKIAKATQSEVILSGDESQLSSVERGGLFSVFANRYGYATLDQVIRQKTAWGKAVSEAFSKGDVLAGLQILQTNNKLDFSQDPELSLSKLLANWSASETPLVNRLILSIANQDVDVLNKGAREILKTQGVIKGPAFEIENKSTCATFAQGDRIVITETDKNIGVKNGDFGTITQASERQFTLFFDNGKEININPTALHFKHGYAVTVFKSQAASIDSVFVYHSGFGTIQNAYVEMSRHIQDLAFYCNRENSDSLGKVAAQLALNLDAGSSLQYKTAADFAEKDRSLLGKVRGWVHDKATGLSDRFHQNESFYHFQQEHPVTENTIRAVMEEVNAVTQQAVGAEYNFTTPVNLTHHNRNTASASLGNAKPSVNLVNTAINKKSFKPSTWAEDVARVRADLKFNAERVARDLFGEPNKTFSTNNTLRFGENGKLAIEISGPRQGTWYDFSEGNGGDLLALIQREKNVDFKGSFQLAKSYSFEPAQPNVISELPSRKMTKQLSAAEKQQKFDKLFKDANRLGWPEAELAKDYLTKTRGLESALDALQFSDDFGFTPALWNDNHRERQPALVVFARDKDNKITGAQATFLDAETLDKVSDGPAKRSFGSIAGSFVTVQAANHGPTILAEGLETALSLREARVPGKIVVTLGVHNFKNYPAQADEVIIIAKDNDNGNILTERAMNKAERVLAESAHEVLTVAPLTPGDFNDVLMNEGKTAIQSQWMPVVLPYFEKAWSMAWEKSRSTYQDETLLKDKEDYYVKRCREDIEEAKQLEKDKVYVQTLFEQSQPIKGTLSEEYLTKIKVDLDQLPHSHVRHLVVEDYTKQPSQALAIFMENHQGEKIHCRLTHLDEYAKQIISYPDNLGARTYYTSFVPLQKGSENSPIFYTPSIKTGLLLKSHGIDGDIRATLSYQHLSVQQPENNRKSFAASDEHYAKTSEAAEQWGGIFIRVNEYMDHDDIKAEIAEKEERAEIIAARKVAEAEAALPKPEFNLKDALEHESAEAKMEADMAAAEAKLPTPSFSIKAAIQRLDHEPEKSSLGQSEPSTEKIMNVADKSIENHDLLASTSGKNAFNEQPHQLVTKDIDQPALVAGDAEKERARVERLPNESDFAYNSRIVEQMMHPELSEDQLSAIMNRTEKLEDTQKMAEKSLKTQASQDFQEAELTPKEVMTEIEKNYQYLEDNWWKNTSNKSFGVKDFEGNHHNQAESYLVAIAQDANVYDKIDYNSKIGKEMREELQKELKQYMPPRCIAGLKALEQPIEESNLSSKEITAEIEKNYQYLESNWRNNLSNERFGIKDFQGNHHNRPWSYLVDVAQDPSVYNKIDYTSNVAKEMRSALAETFNQEMPHRCIAELKEKQIDYSIQNSREFSMEKDSGLGL